MTRFIMTIQAVLIAVKMADLTHHSWWWILCPTWATIIVGLIVVFASLLFIRDDN